MPKAATLRNSPEAAAVVVCLLLFWHWAGFFTVLCVSGPEHTQLEGVDSACCGDHRPGGTRLSGAGDECFGCADVGMPAASLSGSRQHQKCPIPDLAALLPPVDDPTAAALPAAPLQTPAQAVPPPSDPPALASLRC